MSIIRTRRSLKEEMQKKEKEEKQEGKGKGKEEEEEEAKEPKGEERMKKREREVEGEGEKEGRKEGRKEGLRKVKEREKKEEKLRKDEEDFLPFDFMLPQEEGMMEGEEGEERGSEPIYSSDYFWNALDLERELAKEQEAEEKGRMLLRRGREKPGGKGEEKREERREKERKERRERKERERRERREEREEGDKKRKKEREEKGKDPLSYGDFASFEFDLLQYGSLSSIPPLLYYPTDDLIHFSSPLFLCSLPLSSPPSSPLLQIFPTRAFLRFRVHFYHSPYVFQHQLILTFYIPLGLPLKEGALTNLPTRAKHLSTLFNPIWTLRKQAT